MYRRSIVPGPVIHVTGVGMAAPSTAAKTAAAPGAAPAPNCARAHAAQWSSARRLVLSAKACEAATCGAMLRVRQ